MRFEEFKKLVKQDRSYRRFDESMKLSEDKLAELIGLVRYCPSTANSQALKFMPVYTEKGCAAVFETLGWAAALPEWNGPAEGERPGGYIIVLCDRELAEKKPVDTGICAQTIMLGAAALGYGGCMLANIRRKELMEALLIDPERFSVELVLALGKPAETVQIVDLPEVGSVKYYRDAEGRHYVPKRGLEELIVKSDRN